MSNLYGRKEVRKERRVKGGTIKDYKKHSPIEMYNQYINGLDLSN